jgi:signal transduction histidine kinase
MIDLLRKKKSPNLSECIEEIFFRAMLTVGLIGCTLVVLMDLIVTRNLSYIIPANLAMVVVLLVSLYAIRRLKFHKAALYGVALLNIIIIVRGFIYPEFHHVTCILLITVGFMCALVRQGRMGQVMQWGILVSFIAFLFRDSRQVAMVVLIRGAVPYLVVYFIITILSGLLKERYTWNQNRLTELVALLNQKNTKINEQHARLQASYKELSDLNNYQEVIIKQKTSRIAEKNKQLAQLSYENSHSLRAPLARMLGLLHLIQVDPERKDFYLSKLDDQALEMDHRIYMVSKSIERNLHE